MSRRPAARTAGPVRTEQILHAARALFAERGFERTAMADIADRLGLSEPAIYKHFAGKRELLLKVLDGWYEEMYAEYAVALAGTRGTRDRLRLLVARHLHSVKDNPKLCRLMFREVRAEEDYPGSGLHAQNRRYTQLLVEVLKEGVAAGELRASLPLTLLRDMIYGGIEHHTWGYVASAARGPAGGRVGLDADALADDIVEVLWRGASAPAVRVELRAGARK